MDPVTFLLALPLLLVPVEDPVSAAVDREAASLDALYRALHASPELSYHERETSERLATELERLGFQVTKRVGRFEDAARTSHGVVAVLRNGEGPTVLLRADMDALPIEERTGLPWASVARGPADSGESVFVMHACGHDVHMTCLVGAARVLAGLRARWSGTLVLVLQPAEERAPGGAEAMLADGLYERFPKPDFALALHCDATLESGKVGWVEGWALANVDTVDVTVRGVGGHGAYPQATKDPIVIAAQIVLALQTIVSREIAATEPAVVTVGSIHGGTKHNVIPDEVALQLTVRSYGSETRAKVLAAIERIVLHTARAAGVPEGREPLVDLHPERFVPSTWNAPDLVRRATATLRSTLGAENVVAREPVMGGEDFGRFSLDDRSVPCFMFWLGTVAPERVARAREGKLVLPSLHSSAYAPEHVPAIRTGVRALAACVLDLLPAR